MEGRVEMCTTYNSWGTVCNKQWTPSHTRVVCRNLGYSDSEGNNISYVQNFCEYPFYFCVYNTYFVKLKACESMH